MRAACISARSMQHCSSSKEQHISNVTPATSDHPCAHLSPCGRCNGFHGAEWEVWVGDEGQRVLGGQGALRGTAAVVVLGRLLGGLRLRRLLRVASHSIQVV